ncbi:hypothetical protein [Pseudomonas sp. NPDC090208]|uniref:hypothetical protein n=1 Tax=Pseudomonas sp. NPDC090208 TaxID=3364478 RepID=UPI00381AAA35
MLDRWTPGFIGKVDRDRREVRVSFPPHTDGASELPIAELNYPLGDHSPNTEIRLVEGTPIWLDFRGGDPRYPIIIGQRAINEGNEVGTRRWNHDNFELNADKNFTINAGESINLIVDGTSFRLTAAAIKAIAGAHTIEGPVTQTGGDMTSDGISAQKHTHVEQGDGKPVSPPQ